MKDREISEELLQDAFVKIWGNIDSYNEKRGRLFTWMVRISRNTCFDKLSSKHHQHTLKNISIDNFLYLEDIDTTVNSGFDAIGIKDVIKHLEPEHVKLIELLYFKGYTQKEASEELAIPLGTVKTRNRICIKQLRLIVNMHECKIPEERLVDAEMYDLI